MAGRSSSQRLSLWQRYRGAALTSLAALVIVVFVEVVFPGVDLSRGSEDRYWLLGALVLVVLVVVATRRLVSTRRRSAGDEDGPHE